MSVDNFNHFFFIHIPKTGGTTFHSLLKEQFEENEIFPNTLILENNNGEYPPINNYIRNDKVNWSKIKFIYGHYAYGITSQFPNAKIITFLRNPIDRTISNLYHIKTHNVQYQNMSLNEIFNDKLLLKKQFSNMQTKYLLKKDNYTKTELSYSELSIAKEVLSSLSFVGVTEEFEQSINKFNHKYGFSLKRNTKLNKTYKANKPSLKISHELYEQIVVNNFYDIELYNLAVEILMNTK